MSTTNDDCILLSNLPDYIDGGFEPAPGVGDGWVAVDYESNQGIGVGLAAGAESTAEPIALDINVKGNALVSIGLGPRTDLRVWLDGDRGYREFRCEHTHAAFQECRFKVAALTGRRLWLDINRSADARGAYVGWVRVRAESRVPARGRGLVATNDGFTWIARDGIQTIRDVRKCFEPFRNQDFHLLLWSPVGADVTGHFQTQLGTFGPSTTRHAFRREDRRYAASIARMANDSNGILKTAVASAREAGLAIHFYIRPEAFFCPFPHDAFVTSDLISDYPQYRCRDEFDQEVMRISYAHPEVQAHMLAYIEELMTFEPDGLCLAFNRSLPLMICEDPVIEAYTKAHGEYPDLPSDINSQSFNGVRQQLLADFLLRLRATLQAHGKQLSAVVPANHAENCQMGLDIRALMRQKVFDQVMIHGDWMESSFWTNLRRECGAEFYADFEAPLAGERFDHRSQADAMETIMDMGFSGGFLWDTEQWYQDPYNWHAIPRLGVRERVEDFANGRIAPPLFDTLHQVRGVRLDRYNPGLSF